MKNWVLTILCLATISISGYSNSNNLSSLVSNSCETNSIISILASATDLQCYGDATGNINVIVTGGQPPYNYDWSTADGSGLEVGAANQAGLSAGIYRLLVTDAIGDTQYDEYTLIEPASISILADLTLPDCQSETLGSIRLNVAGGWGQNASDYRYLWTTVDGSGLEQEVANQENLTQGTYSVVVTDANGCTNGDTYILGLNDVFISLIICEEDLPWPGVFCQEITDANGCVYNECINLTVIASSPDYITDLTICEEELPYEWNGHIINELNEIGTYTNAVTDASGCGYLEVLNLNIIESNDIALEVTITPSDLPFVWRGMELTEAGSYTVLATDSAGCPYEDTLILIVSNQVSIYDQEGLDITAYIYPNPAQDLIYIDVENKLNLIVTNKLGQKILDTKIQEGKNLINADNWHNGIYILQFSNADKQWSEMVVIDK